MVKAEHMKDARQRWLTMLLQGPSSASDPDSAIISDGAKIIVAGTRPGVGVSTKCASLRKLAQERGDDVSILDAGVISQTLLYNLEKQDSFTGCILVTHRGAIASEASRWITGLGAATRASYMAARYPWQADDDLMHGRDDILAMLDVAVYRYILGQLPPESPEIKLLKDFAENLRKPD
jgi:hypothetical protein